MTILYIKPHVPIKSKKTISNTQLNALPWPSLMNLVALQDSLWALTSNTLTNHNSTWAHNFHNYLPFGVGGVKREEKGRVLVRSLTCMKTEKRNKQLRSLPMSEWVEKKNSFPSFSFQWPISPFWKGKKKKPIYLFSSPFSLNFTILDDKKKTRYSRDFSFSPLHT